MIRNRIWSVSVAGMMAMAWSVQAWVDLVDVSGWGDPAKKKRSMLAGLHQRSSFAFCVWEWISIQHSSAKCSSAGDEIPGLERHLKGYWVNPVVSWQYPKRGTFLFLMNHCRKDFSNLLRKLFKYTIPLISRKFCLGSHLYPSCCSSNLIPFHPSMALGSSS